MLCRRRPWEGGSSELPKAGSRYFGSILPWCDQENSWLSACLAWFGHNHPPFFLSLSFFLCMILIEKTVGVYGVGIKPCTIAEACSFKDERTMNCFERTYISASILISIPSLFFININFNFNTEKEIPQFQSQFQYQKMKFLNINFNFNTKKWIPQYQFQFQYWKRISSISVLISIPKKSIPRFQFQFQYPK